jgi:hypothetical protein
VNPNLKNTLATAVIKGLHYKQHRRDVSFAVGGSNFDFGVTVERIKVAYHYIGEPDPPDSFSGMELPG